MSVVVAGCGESFNGGPGGVDAGQDVTGADAATCTPRLCVEQGVECGAASDGCGKAIDCGRCGQANFACTDAKCSCRPRSCADQGAECGTIPDGCGNTFACPQCPADKPICGGGGDHLCGTVACTPKPCGDRCGIVSDGCGSTVDCGNRCVAPKTCGGGGVANACGCTPKTCAQLGWQCGSGDDGCGGVVTCASCGDGACNERHKCCSTADPCLGKFSCGTALDGCGTKHRCGDDPTANGANDGACKAALYPHFYQCSCLATQLSIQAPTPLPVEDAAVACAKGPTPPLPSMICVNAPGYPEGQAWCCQ